MEPESDREIFAVVAEVDDVLQRVTELLCSLGGAQLVAEDVDSGWIGEFSSADSERRRELLLGGANFFEGVDEVARTEREGFVAGSDGRAPLFVRVSTLGGGGTARILVRDERGHVDLEAPLMRAGRLVLVATELPVHASPESMAAAARRALVERFAVDEEREA